MPASERKDPKDWWDVTDILLKAAIPLAVASSVYIWNVEKTKRDATAQMVAIAVSILTADPDKETPTALRIRAIDVLMEPTDPPKLTQDAASALKREALPSILSRYNAEAVKALVEGRIAIEEAIRNIKPLSED